MSIVNDTSNKQYEDFNADIKRTFSQNLQQIQDMITGLHKELEQSKVKMSEMEKEVNAVDMEAKKGVEKVSDRMEVERCVVEMVSWVSEQLTNQQVVDNLNKVAKKVNEMGEKMVEERTDGEVKEVKRQGRRKKKRIPEVVKEVSREEEEDSVKGEKEEEGEQ